MTTPTAGPSLEDLETALSKLTSSLELLRAFAHRNRNQHRVSKWWASFDVLRRNTAKLADDVHAAMDHASQPQPKKKRKKAEAVSQRPGSEKPPLESAPGIRASWMRAECLPRAFLSVGTPT